ncbi:PTS fructose transporter subunit IIB [Halostella litorea]|uniref:PTS fructose transporter subunit IIB n=1 Tax=Halostella litorea TaxID=2528831 RepID=UPI0010927660|nr:PTS fructose transporter subunit IIB [Halostella litorea]
MNIVAVTSCPTGIAHSQMAAENLEQTAEELGHDIRVEIQGAMGAEDELSADEIADAGAVVIAADTAVSRDRFDGKPVVKGTVKDAVNDARSLLERAVEAAETGETGEIEAETSSEGDAGTDAGEQQVRRGGDRSKSLVARLKRLFS